MGRLPVLLKRHWPALGFAALLAAGFAALASGSSAQIEAALLALAAFGFVVHWRSARGMTYRDARARSRTTRLSHKTRTLDILYEVVASLNMSSNRYELFLDFLSSLATLLDASAAQLRLLSAEATSDHVASHGDFAAALADWGLQDIERQLQRQVTDSGRVLLHPLAAGTPERLAPELVVAPIQYRGQVMGTFSVLLPRSSREFGDDFRDLMTSIGRHVGLALEKHRVDDYARHIAVLEERDQLRAELHDSLAQSLVSIRLQLKILGETLFKKNFSAAQDQTRLLKQAADEAHSSLRQLLASFRVKMNHKGLVPALEEAVERFRTDAGIRTVFHHDTPELPLSPTQEVELFRIVQEALANIRRHAQARTVRVLLTHEDADRYRLLIEDDGVGIYPAAAHPESGHNLGLAIMRDRARRLHADLEIESEPGEGTRVTIVFHPGAGLRVAS